MDGKSQIEKQQVCPPSTGLGQKAGPRLREYCRQGHAEVVSKSSNKIQQTWGPHSSLALTEGVNEKQMIVNQTRGGGSKLPSAIYPVDMHY